MRAHDFMEAQTAPLPPNPGEAASRILPEMVTFLHYVFVACHGGRRANALPATTYRGHRAALEKAEVVGAVKLIESSKHSGKPRRFWVLTESAKMALANHANY